MTTGHDHAESTVTFAGIRRGSGEAPFDIEKLRKEAEQLWGEAVARYLEGKKPMLAPENARAWAGWMAMRDETSDDGGPYADKLQALNQEWWEVRLQRREVGTGRGECAPEEGCAQREVANFIGHPAASARQLAGWMRAAGMQDKKTNGVKRWFASAHPPGSCA